MRMHRTGLAAVATCLALTLAACGSGGGSPDAASPAASTTVSPLPTAASPSPTAAPIPITLPVPQDGAITFANATSQVKKIPATAWQRVQDSIAANPATTVPTTLVIGPHTPTTEAQIKPLLDKTMRVWSGFRQPPTFTAIAYNAKDEPWALTQWPLTAAAMNLQVNPTTYANKITAGCRIDKKVVVSCAGGMSQVFPGSDAGIAFFGVEGKFWTAKSLRAHGAVGPISQVGHEYTHNVQFAQWIGTTLKPGENVRSDSAHAGMPCWFFEGQANAIGITVAAPDLASYSQTRLDNVTRRIDSDKATKPSLKRFSASALTKFLAGQDPATCYDPGRNGDYQLGYSVGYAATEVLVAIGGPQSTMALLALTSTGKTWAEAFEAVYGVSWDKGASVIGRVLAAEYKANPIQH